MSLILAGCLAAVVLVLLVVVIQGGKSLNVFMLRREVGDAVRKARPGGRIVDVEVDEPGALQVVVEDRCERHRVHVGSCGEYTAAVSHDPTFALPRSGSFRIDDQTSTLATQVAPDQEVEVRERIEAAIDTSLPARGFHRMGEGSPDILVLYHTAIDRPLSAAELAESYGYAEANWIAGTRSDQDEEASSVAPVYVKGSLVLDILEPATRRLTWRAAVVADIVWDVPVNDRIQRIQDAVELAFRFFPPEPSASASSSADLE